MTQESPSRERLERLVRATVSVHTEHTLEGVLQQVADVSREVIGARYAALGVLDSTGEGLSQFVTSGMSPEQHERIGSLPNGRGVLGLLISHPQALRLPDIAKHPKAFGFPPNHPTMHSFLGVPIRGRSGPFGNLYLTEKIGAAEFSEQDESVAVMLAAQAAVAIDNARLYEETNRLLTEVRGMQASRDRFFAMINHELRNALTAVFGWSELLVRKAGKDVPRAAREVYESAERTLALLNDLLDLSRLEAARLKPVIRDCEAWALMLEASATVEPAAQARGVRIEMSGPGDEMPCRTDPQRIRQILINVLSNAVRHNPDNEPVRVSLEVFNNTLRYQVTDSGPGLTPEQQEMIFEAFVQAGTKQERGTGLGLTLSRQLARLLGGDLRVTSHPGAGATFLLDIPRYHGAS